MFGQGAGEGQALQRSSRSIWGLSFLRLGQGDTYVPEAISGDDSPWSADLDDIVYWCVRWM